MFKGLSPVFNAENVANFVKNIMKTFLIVVIGFPYCQNCVTIAERMQDTEENPPEEENEETIPEQEQETMSEEKIDERRNSDISFFSFKDSISL